MITRRAVLAGAGALSVASQAHAAAPNPPLWRLGRGRTTVWLFGSTPLKAGTEWMAPKIETAFAESGALWVENPEYRAEDARKVIEELGLNPKRPLTEELGPEDGPRLIQVLKSAGMEPDALNAQKPWCAYLPLSSIADQKGGIGVVPERVLKAKAGSKTVKTEWRSLEEVMRYSATAPHAVQLQLVRKTLAEAERGPDASLAEAWLRGDLAPWEARDRTWRSQYPELYQRMVVDRNMGWLRRVGGMLDEPGTHFVCVGVGHLIGPESIQAKARRGGLRVTEA